MRVRLWPDELRMTADTTSRRARGGRGEVWPELMTNDDGARASRFCRRARHRRVRRCARQVRARRDLARRLAAIPARARHLRAAAGRRADAADQGPAGHRHRRSQMRALAGVAARYSRGFCHVTTRQNIQYHFVQLNVVEEAMRDARRRGADDARGVRQLGAQHHRLPVRRHVGDARSST